jgi:hypothetical protein
LLRGRRQKHGMRRPMKQPAVVGQEWPQILRSRQDVFRSDQTCKLGKQFQ